jgi:hypothetical protein
MNPPFTIWHLQWIGSFPSGELVIVYQVSRAFATPLDARGHLYASVDAVVERNPDKRIDLKRQYQGPGCCMAMRPLLHRERGFVCRGRAIHVFAGVELGGTPLPQYLDLKERRTYATAVLLQESFSHKFYVVGPNIGFALKCLRRLCEEFAPCAPLPDAVAGMMFFDDYKRSEGMLKKILELSASAGPLGLDETVGMEVTALRELLRAVDAVAAPSALVAKTLELPRGIERVISKMLQWPQCFPALDLLSLAVLSPQGGAMADQFLPRVLQLLERKAALDVPEAFLALRVVANCCRWSRGLTAVVGTRDVIARLLPHWCAHSDKRVENAAAACLLNLAQVIQFSVSESVTFDALSTLCHALLLRAPRNPLVVQACLALALSADMPTEDAAVLKEAAVDPLLPEALRNGVANVLKIFGY